MKLHFIVMSILLFAASAPAQLEVTLEIEHSKVLLHESVSARVEIVNDTSEAIRVGCEQSSARLGFNIVDATGRSARVRTDRSYLKDPLLIEPWQSGEFEMDLASVFNISKALPYTISCNAAWRGDVFSSNREFLEVVPGMVVDRKQAGYGEKGRIYTLLYIHRKGRAKLFLKVQDAERSICYGVYELGDYIRMAEADILIDSNGRAHLLHQSGPRRYTYHRLNKMAIPEEKKFYSGAAGEVRLRRNPDGSVRLIGGRKYEGDTYTLPYEYDRNRILE